jgi:hypothetical protein
MSQRSSVEIHQGLFGYQDGHRLLASSLELDDESAATVLTLSDLATASGEVGPGYWTGVPLPRIKCYALIRTWLAPEMPRPGCVWSHVLYIKFSDMGRIPDLGAVGRLARYPSWPLALADYQSPLEFEVVGHGSAGEQRFTREHALQVLRRIYVGGVLKRQEVPRASLEAVTFEIWSQQWPRLRRSFPFRTTGQGYYPRSVRDLMTERVESDLPAQTAGEAIPRDWEAAAIEDLFDAHGGEFRQFVWRYGSDVRQSRDRFVFLSGVFVATQSKTLAGPEVRALLEKLSRELSDPSDGRLLKQHVMAAGRARFSLVPPCDGLEVLEFYARSGKASGLPAPDEDLLETLGNDWPVGSDRLLRVTSSLLDEREPFGDQLARRIGRVAKADSLLSDGAGYPNVLRIAVSEAPSLLDDKAIVSLEPSLIGDMLQRVPDGGDLANHLVDRLFGMNDTEIAQTMARKAPDAVLRRLISDRSAAARGASEVKGSAWLAAGRRIAAAVDASTALDRVSTFSELAAWCWLFDYSTTLGLRLPISNWAAAFSRSTDDVGSSEKITVYAYAFVLASVRPERGCEPLLELTFAPLHRAIVRGALTPRARTLLESHLPPLAWWKNWDMGVRLKQGVVNAFVGGQLDVSSFLRLTSDTYDMEQLVELAEDTHAGRRYLGR